MKMNIFDRSEVKVGAFVVLGLFVLGFSLFFLGGPTSLTRTSSYRSYFETVDGMVSGAKVVLAGIQVGVVKEVSYSKPKKKVEVVLEIKEMYRELVHTTSTTEIKTMGVLGDKFLVINPSDPNDPIATPGDTLETQTTGGITEFMGKSDQLLGSLNSIAGSLDRILKSVEKGNRHDKIIENLTVTSKNLADSTTHLNDEVGKMELRKTITSLNSILDKVNQGTGTLGALVNDSSLFDDAKTFMGGVNRNRIMRNLVRKTIQDSEKSDKEDGKK